MKKNITINLCGRLFQIDEDAYELLQQYIESLHQSFGKQEGGEEIADDIEARIAELFDELRQQGIEAITIEHVKDIITRIGKPEELADDSPNDNANANPNGNGGHRYDSFRSAAQGIRDNVRARTAGKRLYRNPNDKMLAGVLSGIATYTGSEVTWWRLGYALLLIGSNIFAFPLFRLFHLGGLFFHFDLAMVLLYIVLAIAMPMPKTPKQKLEMEGKDVTPQNLADVVVEEKKPAQSRRGCVGSFFSVLMSIVIAFFVGISAICGLALLVCLLLIIVSIVIVFTVPAAIELSLPFNIETMNLPELINIHPWVVVAFIVGLLLALIIPVYAIGHMLFSRAGKVQPMGIGQRIAWIVLWIAALCSLIPAFIWIEQQESERYQARLRQELAYQGVVMNPQDSRFLRQGGWDLIKGENCAHYTSSGEYYNDNRHVRYLDAYNENCEEVYQVEHREKVEPGIYRLDCIARAEGPGAFIYAKAGEKRRKGPYRGGVRDRDPKDKPMLQQIPVYGNKGGELIKQLQQGLADIQKNDTSETRDITFNRVNLNINGMEFDIQEQTKYLVEGRGWSVVSIDNIEVTDYTIAYGVSTDQTFTGQPCRAQWFSATDFKLTRTGDLPKSKRKK